MLKTFATFRLAVFGLCVLGLFGSPVFGQGNDRHKDHSDVHPNGIVQDWSQRHIVYPRFGPIHNLIAVQHDPRAILSWQADAREDWRRARNFGHHHTQQSGLQRDWSISLGGGTTAPAMYPAKYNFDPTANPDCANDFVVFPVNVTGGSAQPNIVAFNNLYSGTAGGTGLCSSRTPGSGITDNVDSATTFWSYDVTAAGGQVATSPALSLDGKKVAFVETATGTTAHFHVLAWKLDDGVGTNLQVVTPPVQITTFTDPLAPAAGSGTASDLALVPASGTASDTLSSPFVDYNLDVAYVGNDGGTLFRIKDVFCTVDPACTGGTPPSPSLDTSWPATGATAGTGTLTVCSGRLTGAVAGGADGNIFVGCSDGNLYGFAPDGTPLSGSPVPVGDGTATGGIVDPPLVDAVNNFVYAASGTSVSGTSSVLVQASAIDLSSPVTATLGAPGQFSLHAPSFNAAYFSSTISTDWMIYEWGLNAAGNLDTLYGVTFSAGHAMNSGAAANTFTVLGSTSAEFLPSTEFLNGIDQLFASALVALTPNFVEENINAFPTAFFTTQTEGSGTSGIIVDNDANTTTFPQASSVYFGVQTSNTAVKLTQSGLN